MVSNIFYFHPYLGKWSNLTNFFQLGWNHQQEKMPRCCGAVAGLKEKKALPATEFYPWIGPKTMGPVRPTDFLFVCSDFLRNMDIFRQWNCLTIRFFLGGKKYRHLMAFVGISWKASYWCFYLDLQGEDLRLVKCDYLLMKDERLLQLPALNQTNIASKNFQ